MLVDERVRERPDFLPSVEVSARHVRLGPETGLDLVPERVERVHAELQLQRRVRFPVGIEHEVVVILILRFVVENRVVELTEHPDRAVERHFDHDVDVGSRVFQIVPLVDGGAAISDELVDRIEDFVGFRTQIRLVKFEYHTVLPF